MRTSGISDAHYIPPPPHGVGTMGAAARDFVDFLQAAGQTWWQLCPSAPPASGLPYQTFSTFAGNPYFIDLDDLRDEGLLEREEYEGLCWGPTPPGGLRPALPAALPHSAPCLQAAPGRSRPGVRRLLRGERLLAGGLRFLHGPQGGPRRRALAGLGGTPAQPRPRDPGRVHRAWAPTSTSGRRFSTSSSASGAPSGLCQRPGRWHHRICPSTSPATAWTYGPTPSNSSWTKTCCPPRWRAVRPTGSPPAASSGATPL